METWGKYQNLVVFHTKKALCSRKKIGYTLINSPLIKVALMSQSPLFQALLAAAPDRKMATYLPYIEQLEELALGKEVPKISTVKKALDGEAYTYLRKLVPLTERRATGAFFTSSALATKLASKAKSSIRSAEKIIDPTCGAGALLISFAKHLPVKKTLNATLKMWGEKLYGFDLHPEFVYATKLRLLILASNRCGTRLPSNSQIDYFPNIKLGNALEHPDIIASCDCIALNPPYGLIDAHKDCSWSSGRVTAAGLFLDEIVSWMKPGAKLYSILPEVLQCGQRYKKLAEKVEACSRTLFREPVGQFDIWTDVDVFLYALKKNKAVILREKTPPKRTGKKLGDYFEVRVGPVVPFRDKKVGPLRNYIDCRNLPAWEDNYNSIETRRYQGTCYTPPFVAIRRNSRPDDKFRAIGTIVSGPKAPMAVENHLIIAIPKSKTKRDCLKLLTILQKNDINDYLNEAIRCRHLTVASVKEIPLRGLDD